ncbi:MAG TPA: hypothetical protein VFC10_05685 [Terriglobia bacterium]|jgi:hypothetical protein|nr:hypothetical protein [Terriglobia bacterium]
MLAAEEAYLGVAGELVRFEFDFPGGPIELEQMDFVETPVHIAVMSRAPEQIHFIDRRNSVVGFDFFGLMGKLRAETQTPRTKAQILDLLRTEGEKF